MTITPNLGEGAKPESYQRDQDSNGDSTAFNDLWSQVPPSAIISPRGDDLVGTVFTGAHDDGTPAQYEIRRLLGKGGMGGVYEAQNLRGSRQIRALKLMNLDASKDSDTVYRFKKETDAATKIHHRNVVQIIAQGTAQDGRPFFTMPLLEGQSLSRLLATRRKLPVGEALSIFMQVCAGLGAAHDVGTIHRDIKPANIMIAPGENLEHHVIIVDFGIAKLIPQTGDPTMKETTTGNLFGTPLYMSPEQCLGKKVDHRTDIYSLGCLMYETLTGAPPLAGHDSMSTMYKQIHDLPNPLSNLGDADVRLVQRLDQIISKTLQKEPENRYQTVSELAADLESASSFASRKVPLVSIIGLRAQAIYRDISNRLGTSKRTVVILAGTVLLVTVVSVGFVIPFVTTTETPGSTTDIPWQTVNPPPSHTAEKYKSRETNLTAVFAEQLERAPVSPDMFTVLKDTADLCFKNQKYDKAAVLYRRTIYVGDELIKQGIQTQIVEMASCSLRAAFCQLKLMNYEKVVGLCSEGLVQAKQSNLRPDDQAFFYGIRAVAYSNLGKEKLAKSDAAVFMGYLDKQDFKPEESYDIGPLASRIGDLYLTNGNVMQARDAYNKAVQAWTALEDRGKYNLAIGDMRLAQIERDAGNGRAAVEHLQKAIGLLEAIPDKNNPARVRALFSLADVYWKEKDYLRALSTRATAIKAKKALQEVTHNIQSRG